MFNQIKLKSTKNQILVLSNIKKISSLYSDIAPIIYYKKAVIEKIKYSWFERIFFPYMCNTLKKQEVSQGGAYFKLYNTFYGKDIEYLALTDKDLKNNEVFYLVDETIYHKHVIVIDDEEYYYDSKEDFENDLEQLKQYFGYDGLFEPNCNFSATQLNFYKI